MPHPAKAYSESHAITEAPLSERERFAMVEQMQCGRRKSSQTSPSASLVASATAALKRKAAEPNGVEQNNEAKQGDAPSPPSAVEETPLELKAASQLNNKKKNKKKKKLYTPHGYTYHARPGSVE
ncbi:hypothetical protein AC578_9690 [Pseudocercospora eumusae]|uniref:Uncharacterized protein n=1 Tax=Pseudocercospora eumusae TaxID=321146 RepID=A0A139HQS8_9PEZI|nr:hypothetical protein AC578_9690 [Pseudocercospora eumusae]